MPSSHSPPSPNPNPAKRQRQSSVDGVSPISPSIHDGHDDHSPSAAGDGSADGGGGASAGKIGQSSNFRNVSACNRCRLRKNRCDQRLPSCASCAKAGVACVGYDPITKKEIPRSYVFYLETRVEQLEALLKANNVAFPPAENLELCSRSGTTDGTPTARSVADSGFGSEANDRARNHYVDAAKKGGMQQGPGMLNIVSPSKPRSLASASGVSFARVVFAAVQYSVSDQNGGTPDRTTNGGAVRIGAAGAGTSMRDSFFGLHTKPTIRPAPFPDREVGLRLVMLYFEHANPQIPILHRPEFMQMFDEAYAAPKPGEGLGPRELYMLNMVFAIGCGVIVGEPMKSRDEAQRLALEHERAGQAQPEEYHASAIVHLEACLSNSGGGLEVLQAVLLLANFALLRPVPPGLWYIIGVAVRLAVDLGLHYEDGSDIDMAIPDPGIKQENDGDSKELAENHLRERGRRLWIRDMRRRLWWCTYSFDRLVSTCVGRPFGISDQVITTEFPSLLDDQYITPTGFRDPPADLPSEPSYKTVAYHYFRLRLLQSEILQVLQYNQAQIARQTSSSLAISAPMHATLPSPFLVRFDSFRSWRIDIDRRLYEWKTSAPTRLETGVMFSTEFLELNYWQAIIMLYRQSLSVPAMFESEYNTSKEVNSPSVYPPELREDEDRVYLKVAEAGQKILRIYRQLHVSGLVSYTYLSTHHLFMAGISYLYAIWHSPIVRSRLTMDEVDFTILAAKSVFSDLIDKCPPAETCRDAFDRTAKATLKMANSTGGFGTPRPRATHSREAQMDWSTTPDSASPVAGPVRRRQPHQPQPSQQNAFQFDLSLSDTLSSPAMSSVGEVPSRGSPPLPRNAAAFDPLSFNKQQQSRSAPSPSEMGLSVTSDTTALDGTLVPSPTVSRRLTGNSFISPAGPGSTGYAASAAGSVNNAVDPYPDLQSMEFLQNLQQTGGPGGEYGGLEQAQLDLGFGINWDGMHHDFSEGQQVNLFDGFFFGGQQGGGMGGL